MQGKTKVVSVCKNCGAVGQAVAKHCVFCGAGIASDMLLKTRKPMGKTISRAVQTTGGVPEKKKLSLSGMLSLIFGVLAVFAFVTRILSGGVFAGIVGLVLGVASLTKRANKAIPAAIGLGLSIYVLFVNLVWFFHPLFYLF